MNILAEHLNQRIRKGNPHIYEMLSTVGRQIFFPKGILSQGAEARDKAWHLNATVGIALEEGKTMYFDSIMSSIDGILPEESLTYASSYGIGALRKVWKEALYQKNPSLENKVVSLPIVTSGITHAISLFSDLWLDPDDVVILPDMFWGNYRLIFETRNGARISQYSLFSEDGGFNFSGFEQKLKEEARQNAKIAVLLNFPHNPTGYTVTRDEGCRIVDILTEVAEGGTDIIVVVDDAYFGLFYEDQTIKESLFALLCDRHPRLLAIKLDGATKESFVWGLRVGFITYGSVIQGQSGEVYDALEQKTAACVRATISNASHLGQTIVLKSMLNVNFQNEKKEKFEILKRRARQVKEVISDKKYHDAWDSYPFNSGYFMSIRLKSVDAETLRCHLLERYGVGLISLGTSTLRIAFSCLEEGNIQELFDIIYQGVKDLEEVNA